VAEIEGTTTLKKKHERASEEKEVHQERERKREVRQYAKSDSTKPERFFFTFVVLKSVILKCI